MKSRGSRGATWRAWLDGLIVALFVAALASFAYGRFGPGRVGQPVPQSISAPVEQHTSLSLPASEPVAVTIPVINVHSELAHTGLNADGSPAVPVGATVDQASWLTTSATPGATGTAVIIGHVDTVKSGPSIFYNLGKLKPGDEVMVDRQDGRTAVFTVNQIQAYAKDSFPSATVYGRTDSPSLRLITCTGAWDAAAHQYAQNLVAFASLTGSR